MDSLTFQMDTVNLSIINLKILLLLVTIGLFSCNNSTETDFNYYSKETPVLRDTTYSEKTFDILKFQVLDYVGISSKSQIRKFIKYTPKFLYECANIDGEGISKKYDMMSFLNMLFLSSIDQKVKQNKKMKANNYSLKHSIDKNIRAFCNDTTFFANLELITYLYKSSEKRDSVISNFVCLSENNGRDWTFLDKDGCRDFLKCHYSDKVSNYIMEK